MGNNQNQAPLAEQLLHFRAQQPSSFHVPGHKHGLAYVSSDFAAMLAMDVTELPGLDQLHDAQGVIADAQQRAAQLFSAEETYFLINGSTVGNLALLLTVCSPGDVILVQRNAHQSIFNGLMLAAANVVFLEPEWDERSGTALHVSLSQVEHAMAKFPQAKALFLTNPTYYGATLDLSEYAELVHRAGMMLLVDEAHGAHFGFHPAWPRAAMHCGADAAVQSTHKMLAAMTQAGMLHVQGARLDRRRLRRVLAMLQSSSPSYLLMASLDLARARLAERGAQAFSELLESLLWFRAQLAERVPSIHVLDFSMNYAHLQHDPCKLVLQADSHTGAELLHHLANYKCYAELADERNVLLVLSIETVRADLERLLAALEEIKATTKGNAGGIIKASKDKRAVELEAIAFSMAMICDWPHDAELVPIDEAIDAINVYPITPYPPGIPLLLPGEQIEHQQIAEIERLLSLEIAVHGVIDGQSESKIWTIRRK